MRKLLGILIAGAAIIFVSNVAMADNGQLYGKIYTVDDEVFEGFIRWDKNEGSWHDVFDGSKELDDDRDRYYRDRDDRRSRRKRVKVFGLTIYNEDNNRYIFGSDMAESGIMMGHIKTIIPDGDNEVILVLKSGEEVYLEQGSTDIGDDIREILINDGNEGELELYWSDIDKVEFSPSSGSADSFGERLYGTVVTRRGDEYTGYISWDVDEIFDGDILDGREAHRKRKIEFGKIKGIERRSSNSAIVTLKNGKEMRMDDSNDIDSGNRGINIYDKNLGRVTVEWDDFDMVTFTDGPGEPPYSSFDGGKRLEGTVFTEDGDSFTGKIQWDADEEYTWELLDGNYNGIELDIEFKNIAKIEKRSRSSSIVTLKDGREFRLRDSNDVDDDNKGIFILTDNDDDEVMIDWYDFEKVEFK